MSFLDGPLPESVAPAGGSWEALLLSPGSVCRQLDAASGCGPACLAMALALEAGVTPRKGIPDQPLLAELCREASAPEPSSHPFQWETSPAALVHVLNSRPAPDGGRRRALKQYHIVHAASPDGPIEEVLSWLRPPTRPEGPPSLPSFVLVRHGTHWMLAVGAKVGSNGLDWMTMADPTSGQLRGVTAAGVTALFTPNLIGQNPDWTHRRLAVVPSMLPRRPPPSRPDIPRSSRSGTETPVPAIAPSPLSPGFPAPTTPLAPALAPPEEHSLLERLDRIARSSLHPLAQDWLAPLRHARHVVTDDPHSSASADTTRRVWVLDEARLPVADLLLRGTPAVLLQFTIAVPSPLHSLPAEL